jgi:hypothetical protein
MNFCSSAWRPHRQDSGKVRRHLRHPRQEEHCSTPAEVRSVGSPTDRPHPLAAGTFYLGTLGIQFLFATLLHVGTAWQAISFVKCFLSASLELLRDAEPAVKHPRISRRRRSSGPGAKRVESRATRIGTRPKLVGMSPKRVGGRPKHVGRLPTRVGRLAKRVGRLAKRVGALPKRVGRLAKRVGALAKRVGSANETRRTRDGGLARGRSRRAVKGLTG